MIITETWLHSNIPDASMQLAGRTMLRWDRTENPGKSRGGDFVSTFTTTGAIT